MSLFDGRRSNHIFLHLFQLRARNWPAQAVSSCLSGSSSYAVVVKSIQGERNRVSIRHLKLDEMPEALLNAAISDLSFLCFFFCFFFILFKRCVQRE